MVNREQAFAGAINAAAHEARVARYRRRGTSARWVTAEAIAEAQVPTGGAPEYEAPSKFSDLVDDSTGEVLGKAEKWVRPPRVARCGWRMGAQVTVHADPEKGVAHFGGTERCGSIWACPLCAAVIRSERANEIQQAVTRHMEQGGSVVFLTLTLRHRLGDSLAVLLDGLLTCWSKLLQGSAWMRTRAEFGIEGYIRSVEVTWSPENGWHPHVHALLFVGDKPSEAALTRLGDEIHGRWSRYALAAVGRMPTREAGVDVQLVDGQGQVLAGYVSKLQDEGKAEHWSVGHEAARGDVKTGRRGSLVPFELLDEVEGLSVAQRRAMWLEYVQVTRGRRAITWSRGLKARYEIGERSDNEVVECAAVVADVVTTIDGAEYDRMLRNTPGALATTLLEVLLALCAAGRRGTSAKQPVDIYTRVR